MSGLPRCGALSRTSRGFSLIELMVSMVLGLLIVGGATTVFLSNRQTYASTENLSRMQENGRVAFELIARDLREASGGLCQSDRAVRNLLNNSATRWWTNWDTNSAATVLGYAGGTAFADAAFGTGPGDRTSGTQALEIKGVSAAGIMVDSQGPNPQVLTETNQALTVNTAAHGFSAGDLAMVCNFDGSAVFQVTSVAGAVLGHAASGSPGNSTAHLSTVNTRKTPVDPPGTGIKVTCRDLDLAPPPTGYQRCGWNWTATIAKLNATRWYIGANARGGQSLYRVGVVATGGAATPQRVEVAENVTAMNITYLMRNGVQYLDAASVTNWGLVTAVRISLTVESLDNVSVDGGRLSSTMQHTVTLRNRTL